MERADSCGLTRDMTEYLREVESNRKGGGAGRVGADQNPAPFQRSGLLHRCLHSKYKAAVFWPENRKARNLHF